MTLRSFEKLSILQVNTSDIGGGAEKIGWNLYKKYMLDGHNSYLAVGNKFSSENNVIQISNNSFSPGMWPSNRMATLVNRTYIKIRNISKRIHSFSGHEDFSFPGTKKLLNLIPIKPDIVHCHNLHGSYFDLGQLPIISHKVPLLLTLHDAWLLSGHCAHSFDCERWMQGCGKCPDLTIPPAIQKDGTHYNWIRKKKIFSKSRLYVTTPSNWLMKKIEKSMLAPYIIKNKVINNGVDLSIFRPQNKSEIRSELHIPNCTKLLLFAANGITQNIWKDYNTLQRSISLIAEKMPSEKIIFMALGEDSSAQQIGQAKIIFVPHIKNPEMIAKYYQAADIYVHAAKADTFPNTVIESLACGCPVIATAVGGICEQIDEGISGFLTSPGDPENMSIKLELLLRKNDLRVKMSEKSAEIAAKKFDLDKQKNSYLELYREIIENYAIR